MNHISEINKFTKIEMANWVLLFPKSSNDHLVHTKKLIKAPIAQIRMRVSMLFSFAVIVYCFYYHFGDDVNGCADCGQNHHQDGDSQDFHLLLNTSNPRIAMTTANIP